MGRPKKTLNDLPKDWDSIIINNMAEGASALEVQTLLKISDDLWQRLKKEDELFSLTVKKGKQLCQTWWERKGRKNLENKDFSCVLWYMNMKNRFGWKDKQEIKHDGSMVTVNVGKEESDV